MISEVLKTFLSEDADAYVRQLLLKAIAKQRDSGTPSGEEYSFNRFIVTLEFASGKVTVQDDLTVGREGECTLETEEFERLLEAPR